ncbi:MAG TPA: sulfite exporter TauE/SafE family protein [Ghiorsea sp.]|nr:sulfite exporter TauE/SafE family protein [Ghiorsea sp.]HIP07279.1 sulfite exporter TauE/SafE family protein [Mariprofundaceae bacterium]
METLIWMLPYLGLGLVVGFFAGLLGIGGGGIMVPLLIMIFMMQGFDSVQLVHLALGTSMASIVLTSMSSAYHHHKRGAVRWDVWQKMFLGLLLGTFTLSFFINYIPRTFLAIFFSVFMTYVAVQMFLNIKPKPSRTLPNRAGLAATGFGIGGISALVAIGGGTMSVPFLTLCNVRIQHAIATSAALGAPIALAGGLGYALSGWTEASLPAYSVGYVYMPAVLLISGMSVLTVPLGVKLAHRLPVGVLKKVFAVIMLLLAMKMLDIVF